MLGPEPKDARRVSFEQSGGAAGRVGVRGDLLVYEIRVPLKTAGCRPLRVGARAGRNRPPRDTYTRVARAGADAGWTRIWRSDGGRRRRKRWSGHGVSGYGHHATSAARCRDHASPGRPLAPGRRVLAPSGVGARHRSSALRHEAFEILDRGRDRRQIRVGWGHRLEAPKGGHRGGRCGGLLRGQTAGRDPEVLEEVRLWSRASSRQIVVQRDGAGQEVGRRLPARWRQSARSVRPDCAPPSSRPTPHVPTSRRPVRVMFPAGTSGTPPRRGRTTLGCPVARRGAGVPRTDRSATSRTPRTGWCRRV